MDWKVQTVALAVELPDSNQLIWEQTLFLPRLSLWV
jgi:hypothetical protein